MDFDVTESWDDSGPSSNFRGPSVSWGNPLAKGEAFVLAKIAVVCVGNL